MSYKIRNVKIPGTGITVDGEKQFFIKVFFYANERYDPVKHFITRKYDDNFDGLLSDLSTTFRAPFTKVIALYHVENLERITKTKELRPDLICLAAGKVLASNDLKRSANYILQKVKDLGRSYDAHKQPLKSKRNIIVPGKDTGVASMQVSCKTKVSDDTVSETTTQETKQTIKDREKKIVTTVTTITTTKRWKRIVQESKAIPEAPDKCCFRLSRRDSKEVRRARSHSLLIPPEENVFNIKVRTSANAEEIIVEVNTRMDWKNFMEHVEACTKKNIARIVAMNQEVVRRVFDLQEGQVYLALDDNDIRKQKIRETSKTPTRKVSLSRRESLCRRESVGSTSSSSPCRTEKDFQQFPFLYTTFHLNGEEDAVEPVNMIFYPYELQLLSRVLAALTRRFQNNRRTEHVIENIYSIDGAVITFPEELKAGEHYVAVPAGEIFKSKKYSNAE